MKVGDIAVPNRQAVMEGKFLHCGSGRYDFAVVGSVNPFVLVSQFGDMVWTCTWSPHELTYLCRANDEILKAVQTRMKREAAQ